MNEPILDPNYDPRSDGAMRSSGAKLVRPRDAATLIIVRRDAAKPRLLMGRRHGGHDFMPDKWVFPGGRIDRSDFRAPYASDLRPEILARLEKTAPQARCRALALTAVRETFEEAGLLLARAASPRLTIQTSSVMPAPDSISTPHASEIHSVGDAIQRCSPSALASIAATIAAPKFCTALALRMSAWASDVF